MRFFAVPFGQALVPVGIWGIGENVAYEWEIEPTPADEPWQIDVTVDSDLLTPATGHLEGRGTANGVIRFQGKQVGSGAVHFTARSGDAVQWSHWLIEVIGEAS
jgi:hypothetical protein